MKSHRFSQPKKSRATIPLGEPRPRHLNPVVPLIPRQAPNREDLFSDG